MTIKIIANEKGNPPGKLADAELHFGGPCICAMNTDGSAELPHAAVCLAGEPLAGLKLIGFAIWERRGGKGRNVTFPARQYSVNGERRSFALLRPVTDVLAQDRVRDLVLQAYAVYEASLVSA